MKVAVVAIACVISTPAVAPPAALAPAPIAVHYPSVRGGYAKPPHTRGGHALVVLDPIGDLQAWACIHSHEGAWNDNTGNGYHGGLQMDRGFELAYGADMVRKYGGDAELWSPRDQMVVAERGYLARHGYNPWPNTGRACRLPMHVI